MKETVYEKTRSMHSFIKVFGGTVLVFLMLVSTVGAAPFAYITNYGDNTTSVIDIEQTTLLPRYP